jgi:mono/diheme cytochrome c family protein
MTPALLARGRECYGVFCAPCHGPAGRGDGIIVRNGFPTPPSFYEPRLQDMPPERIVAVITEGYGRMWPQAENIPPTERWAIARYVRTLQARGGAERP